jgi:hypothetical protein
LTVNHAMALKKLRYPGDTFDVFHELLNEILKNLESNVIVTKRDLYYQNVYLNSYNAKTFIQASIPRR